MHSPPVHQTEARPALTGASFSEEKYAAISKRVFDNSKISDHFAIIPTLETPRSLTEAEHKIYDLVVKRFIAVFYPPAEYLVTSRVSSMQVGQTTHRFQTQGKVLVNPGWLAVYGREAQDEDANLVPVKSGELVRAESVQAKGLQTRPPAR